MTDPDERLESWKKIAAYLRRDVRTVQRWEETNGLPVHRHQRANRALPYAYKKELDAWWTRQSGSDPALVQETAVESPPSRRKVFIAVAAVLVLGVAGVHVALSLLGAGGAAVPPKSVAVLAFVDLSEDMANEEFADGISEELIDRLNRIPELKVPAPTSTFYFKNKQVPVADIGRSLGVAYVLDGSVRKSGEQVRVAARLIRADDSQVVWSESYDRSWSDMLAVQDDIAGRVTEALESSIVKDVR
jgi:transcriptional activator of cad operon